MTKPQSALDEVTDRATFLEFVRLLAIDRDGVSDKEDPICEHTNSSVTSSEENRTVESFLEAAVAWAEDSQGGIHEISESASWKSFAKFLYAGKYYE